MMYLLLFTIIIWGKLSGYHAQEDLLFIINQIKANHPGIYNTQDQNFVPTMAQAYEKALKELNASPSDEEKKAIIKRYMDSFEDPHCRVTFFNTSNNIQTVEQSCSVHYINPHTAWISLPSFNADHIDKKRFSNILDLLKAVSPNTAIVFDIRGNGGGSSHLGEQIIYALFGESYAKNGINAHKTEEYVEWRASIDNQAYWKEMYAKYKDNPILEPHIASIIKQMDYALTHNKSLFKEESLKKDCFDSTMQQTKKLGPIIALIDHHNGSAALDFLDKLQMMNHPITLIGEATGFDRNYMEVRSVILPSKQGRLIFPMKVYRNRYRKDKQRYFPTISADPQNTTLLTNLVQSIVST